MTNIAHVWMIPGGPAWCREHGVGPGVERFLLKEHNLALGNTGNDWAETLPPFDPGDTFKLIAPMYAYSPSRERWLETYERIEQEFNALLSRMYLYDCGDGDYLGCDEPWTRGGINLHQKMLNWGRMIQRVTDAFIDYPGLKPIITHPRAGMENHFEDAPKVCDLFGNRVVYAFDAHVIEAACEKYWEQPSIGLKGVKADNFLSNWPSFLDIPEDAEIWAYFALYERCEDMCSTYLSNNCDGADRVCERFTYYDDGEGGAVDPYRADWMRHWTPTPCDKPHEVNAWAEERGVSAILHNTRLDHLVDEAAGDPRLMLRPNAVQMLKGEE